MSAAGMAATWVPVCASPKQILSSANTDMPFDPDMAAYPGSGLPQLQRNCEPSSKPRSIWTFDDPGGYYAIARSGSTPAANSVALAQNETPETNPPP